MLLLKILIMMTMIMITMMTNTMINIASPSRRGRGQRVSLRVPHRHRGLWHRHDSHLHNMVFFFILFLPLRTLRRRGWIYAHARARIHARTHATVHTCISAPCAAGAVPRKLRYQCGWPVVAPLRVCVHARACVPRKLGYLLYKHINVL